MKSIFLAFTLPTKFRQHLILYSFHTSIKSSAKFQDQVQFTTEELNAPPGLFLQQNLPISKTLHHPSQISLIP